MPKFSGGNIYICVQYNGGIIPDIILLTRCDCIIGEPVWYHEEFLSLQPMFPPTKSCDNKFILNNNVDTPKA